MFFIVLLLMVPFIVNVLHCPHQKKGKWGGYLVPISPDVSGCNTINFWGVAVTHNEPELGPMFVQSVVIL